MAVETCSWKGHTLEKAAEDVDGKEVPDAEIMETSKPGEVGGGWEQWGPKNWSQRLTPKKRRRFEADACEAFKSGREGKMMQYDCTCGTTAPVTCTYSGAPSLKHLGLIYKQLFCSCGVSWLEGLAVTTSHVKLERQ